MLLLQFPSTEAEWKLIAEGFDKHCNFPHCLGAVDGKHINIVPPPGSGSYYYNYKGRHSLVLMAIVNANYEFIMCDFGVNGRISDGGVIEYTQFYRKLQNGTLHLPRASAPKAGQQILPFVFIADEAFALRPDFLKPFNQKELNHDKKIFNYRLSRGRCKVENAFGIMAARFRIFHTAISINLGAVEKVVMACCVLHNFLRRQCTTIYSPDTCLDKEDFDKGCLEPGYRATNLDNMQRGFGKRSTTSAKQVREQFMNYFVSEGAVPWQERMIQ